MTQTSEMTEEEVMERLRRLREEILECRHCRQKPIDKLVSAIGGTHTLVCLEHTVETIILLSMLKHAKKG